MTVRPPDPEANELRRQVERLLASKHECSATLSRLGTQFVREYERLADALAAAEARERALREALGDAQQLLAQHEYLVFGATTGRWWDGERWTIKDSSPFSYTCPCCGYPPERRHEPGCSLRAVLDGEPALRLRSQTSRRAALAVADVGGPHEQGRE